jgi:hypothetical protein
MNRPSQPRLTTATDNGSIQDSVAPPYDRFEWDAWRSTTLRTSGGNAVTRIIGARPAMRQERRLYEEEIADR